MGRRDQEGDREGMVREIIGTRTLWYPETKGIEFKGVLNEAETGNRTRTEKCSKDLVTWRSTVTFSKTV